MDVTKREWQLRRHCAYLGLHTSRGEKWEMRQSKYQHGFSSNSQPSMPKMIISRLHRPKINKLDLYFFSFVSTRVGK